MPQQKSLCLAALLKSPTKIWHSKKLREKFWDKFSEKSNNISNLLLSKFGSNENPTLYFGNLKI